MPRAERLIDMPQMLSILTAIAEQLDFRAVIRAVSTGIGFIATARPLDVALMNGDGTMVSACETGLYTEWDAATMSRLLNGKAVETAEQDYRRQFGGS